MTMTLLTLGSLALAGWAAYSLIRGESGRARPIPVQRRLPPPRRSR